MLCTRNPAIVISVGDTIWLTLDRDDVENSECDDITVMLTGNMLLYNQSSDLICRHDCQAGKTCAFMFWTLYIGRGSVEDVYWQDLPDDVGNTGPQGDWVGRVDVNSTPGVHTLTINQVQVGDEGLWMCTVLHRDCGYRSAKAWFTVYGKVYFTCNMEVNNVPLHVFQEAWIIVVFDEPRLNFFSTCC